MSTEILTGDCVEVMATMAPNSVDAVVCDPPYELGFMGKSWDASGVAYQVATWAACLRVLKPGGHLLAFGGSRTYHRMACAVEDAGFEIRDQIMWLYGSGFPKSLDVGKAIDQAAGARRDPITHEVVVEADLFRAEQRGEVVAKHGAPAKSIYSQCETEMPQDVPLTAPATEAARQWQGWGTALKPAHEPIVVARKPLIGTVAANVLKHGTGALNVDGCRIEGAQPRCEATGENAESGMFGMGSRRPVGEGAGRWPANVILDEDAGAMLDAQSGVRPVGQRRRHKDAPAGMFCGGQVGAEGYNDTGGASRFFYCPKANRKEREAGLTDMRAQIINPACPPESKGAQSPRAGAGRAGARHNHHPTVKPVALMRYLVRLVTPPGGTVLDPFLGSGTTLMAAAFEGFDAIGIEREAEYVEIAKARVAWAESQPVQMSM